MRKIGNIEITPLRARTVLAIGDEESMIADVKFTVNGNEIKAESHGTRLGIMAGMSSILRRIARKAKESGTDLDVHELCTTIELISIILEDTEHSSENLMTCVYALEDEENEQL